MRLVPHALTAVLLVLSLAACGTVTPPQPTPDPTPTPTANVIMIDGFTVPDFVAYPNVTLFDVTNVSSTTFVNRVIHVSCIELGVYTYFRTAPFTLQPGESRATVVAPYLSGYYMMVDAGVRCSTYVPAATGQPGFDTRWVR